MRDLSKIAEAMKEELEANPDKVIESPLLNKVQVEKLRDDYLSDYKVLGMEPINPGALDISSYVLCITSGGGQRA